MVQLTRKRSILAKIESSYGVDSTPTGAANAILVKNLNVTPLAAASVSRDNIRSYMGGFDNLTANAHVECDFEVEIAGAGAAGTAPAYGALLRACALSETILASALTGTAQAGTTANITLASGASATDNVYVGLEISTTGGTGSGQAKKITAYNGTTKVATVDSVFSVAPDATTTYSIGAGVVYKPVSAGFESIVIYFNEDGVLHKMTGSRGSVGLDVTAKNIPVYKFKFTGIYNAVTDTAITTNVYSSFQTPLVANNTNTSGFKFFGVSGLVLESLSIDTNNVVDFRAMIGSEYVQITDRQASGEVTFEAVSMATFNSFTTALANTTGALLITHGTAAGNRVDILANKVDLGNPSYTDSTGVNMIKSELYILPTDGNDEFAITVR